MGGWVSIDRPRVAGVTRSASVAILAPGTGPHLGVWWFRWGGCPGPSWIAGFRSDRSTRPGPGRPAPAGSTLDIRDKAADGLGAPLNEAYKAAGAPHDRALQGSKAAAGSGAATPAMRKQAVTPV